MPIGRCAFGKRQVMAFVAFLLSVATGCEGSAPDTSSSVRAGLASDDVGAPVVVPSIPRFVVASSGQVIPDAPISMLARPAGPALETHNPEASIHVPLTECVATAPNAAGGRCPANHPRHLRCPTAKRAKLVDCIPSGELSLGGEVTACCH